ncbi:helix-turn-helix transcriptional regulator [Bordetella sp. FB-8]|uniref:helix-turn-helix transcriptional regulator n=1 Tax=Bordetella sp. FB-8 TaxID=1159870 RepID=UPI000361E373|nr:helix-turn-helix transcriptional regulator [Bordetella sp. FB-8]
MSSLATLKKRMLANPDVKAEYEAQAPEFELARELIAARARAGLTQEQLADKMQTTQSTIARMESGRSLPSLRTLARYAEATGSRAVVRLEAAERVRVVSTKRVTKAKPAKRV